MSHAQQEAYLYKLVNISRGRQFPIFSESRLSHSVTVLHFE